METVSPAPAPTSESGQSHERALMVYCSLNLRDARMVVTTAESLVEDVRTALLELGVRADVEEQAIETLKGREFPDEGRFLYESKLLCEKPQRVCILVSQYVEDIASRVQLSIAGKIDLWRSY